MTAKPKPKRTVTREEIAEWLMREDTTVWWTELMGLWAAGVKKYGTPMTQTAPTKLAAIRKAILAERKRK